MNNALLVRDDGNLSVVIASEATELKTSALESASLVVKVDNALQNENAVNAMTEIERVLKLIESSRVEVKAPILDYGRKIDAAAKTFIAELQTEKTRLGRLCGNFQTLQEANRRAEEALRKKELDEIERRKQEAIAQAQSHEELDAIQERANEEAKALPVAPTVHAAGQVVKPEWEVTIVDIDLLNRAYPGCVKKEPLMGEIKALLNVGVNIPGVNAKKVIKAGVRLQREPALIEA